jgi:hypothetical protein
MRILTVLTILLLGCGDQMVYTVEDMGELDLTEPSSDMKPADPSAGQGSGLKLPPCARPEIDQCLGPPARSDILKRPTEIGIKTE